MQDYCLKFGRTLASFVSAILLAFAGDVTGRVFNLLIGYPWPQTVHLNLHMVMIGLGAGVGAYLGWMDLSMPRLHSWAALGLIVVAGVSGAYLGKALGPGVDPTYWWSPFAIDISVHLGAAAAGTTAATAVRALYRSFSGRLKDTVTRRTAMTNAPPARGGGQE